MKYKLKKETKPTLATYGKYKAVAVHSQTVDTPQLLEEICRNEPISHGTVITVVSKLAEVIGRHLRKGDRVRLKDLGLMKLEIESEKVDSPTQFNPHKHIKGVRLHFLPESSKGKPELYQDISFEKEVERYKLFPNGQSNSGSF